MEAVCVILACLGIQSSLTRLVLLALNFALNVPMVLALIVKLAMGLSMAIVNPVVRTALSVVPILENVIRVSVTQDLHFKVQTILAWV
jgi:hypothetical protein